MDAYAPSAPPPSSDPPPLPPTVLPTDNSLGLPAFADRKFSPRLVRGY